MAEEKKKPKPDPDAEAWRRIFERKSKEEKPSE